MAVFWGIIGTVILAYIICAARDALRERWRRRAFQRLAVELGLSYEARDDNLIEHLGLVHALRQGKRRELFYVLGAPPIRYAFNVLSGRCAGLFVQAFDFYCDPSGGSKYMRQPETYAVSVLMVVEQQPFPAVLIYPRARWLPVGEMLKLGRVELEAAEFAQAFVVRAADRRFAYDICHPRMMEYLLEHRDLSLELEGPCVAMTFDRRLEPAEIPGRLEQLVELRGLFPQYLYRP
jgi:hypothetical protein